MDSTIHTCDSTIAPANAPRLNPLQTEFDPAQFVPYRLIQIIGEGGMGLVFAAIDTSSFDVVAIKTIHPTKWNDHRARERFHQEVEMTSRFNHTHVVRAIAPGHKLHVPHLVMEFLDGFNLSQLIKRCGRLSVPDACELARQMALGMQHIHDCGVVHRDIKPANAFLTRQGDIKLLDVGLGFAIAEVSLQDSSQTLVGSFDYMAPEQAFNSLDVGFASDLYGLGATLYHLLTGIPPFASESRSPFMTLLTAKTRNAPSVLDSRPDASHEVSELVARLLAKKPEDRFASAGEVADSLARLSCSSNLKRLIERYDSMSVNLLGQPASEDRGADLLAPTIDFAEAL